MRTGMALPSSRCPSSRTAAARTAASPSPSKNRQGIPVNQRRKSQNCPQSPPGARAAQPRQHIAGGDGIPQLTQGARRHQRQFQLTLLHRQPEHGHGANHAHAAQFEDGCPSGDIGAGTEYVPAPQVDQGLLHLGAAQFASKIANDSSGKPPPPGCRPVLPGTTALRCARAFHSRTAPGSTPERPCSLREGPVR